MQSKVKTNNIDDTHLDENKEFSHQTLIKDKNGMDGLYAKYVLSVLTLVHVFNFLDRQILTILAEDIKTDLGLSDGDLGFLAGTAFAVFYAIFGIPLGRLADKWHRIKMVSLGLGFWSLMTGLSGTVKNFGSLAAFRFGVGVGEASATPAIYSILYDYFSPRIRTTVLAVYNSGLYIGMGLGLFLGGSVLDSWNGSWPDSSLAPFGLKGWQVAFTVVGLPGLLLALWVATLREPSRDLGDGLVSSSSVPIRPIRFFLTEMLPMIPLVNLWLLRRTGAKAGVLIVNIAVGGMFFLAAFLLTDLTGDSLQWKALALGYYCAFSWIQSLRSHDPVCFNLVFRCKTLVYLYIGVGLLVFTGAAWGFWSVPYLQRYYGMSSGELGTVMGLSIALAGVLGVLIGGVVADKLRLRTQRGKLYVAFIANIASLAVLNSVLLTEQLAMAYLLNFLHFLFTPMAHAPLTSTVTDLTIPRTRAVAVSLYIMITIFLGAALGPYFVGLLSDVAVAKGMGSGEALRQGMLWGLVPQAIGMLFLALAIKHLPTDEGNILLRARALGEKI
mgnify:CR=1 FL=1